MEQNSKQKMMDTIVARMQMHSEGIPESVAERAINLQIAQEEADDAALSSGQLYKKEMMDVITRRLSGGSLSKRIANRARDIYRAGLEPDASWYRPSDHRPPTQPVYPNTYEQAAYEKHKKESQSLGLQPLWNILDRIKMNNKRLIEKDEIDRMCSKNAPNFKSLSEEEKAEFWDKCLP